KASDSLEDLVASAGRAIYRHSLEHPELEGMGTTCVAVSIHNGSAMAAHVGDSRLYLVRRGNIYQMTEDHSVVAEMVRSGMLTPQEARHHQDRNVLSRALGTQASVEVAVWDREMPLREGDLFLLATDGLHDLVEDPEILALLSSRPPG